jgi:hypothetical protein
MLTTAYYFLQVILCSGLMIGYYWLVLRNKRFHQYNRFYLLAITLLSWIVPLIKIQLNHTPIAEDAQVMQFLYVVADSNSQIDQNLSKGGFEWNSGVFFIGLYALVSAVLLFFMIRVFVRLYRLLKTHSCKNVGDVYLILTRADGTPFSFFRYIFWNEEIDLRTETGKQILQHELTHVQQKHSIDKLFMQVVLVAGWFNPFFWLIRREMEMIHEFIADKKAIENGDTASLAQMLLTAAYPQQRFAMTNPFFFSPIRRRLKMLANNRDPRFTYIRRLVVLPLLAMVTILFAFRSKSQDETLSVASVMENVINTVKDGFVPQKPEESANAQPLLLTEESKILIQDTVIYRKKKDKVDEKKVTSAMQLLKQDFKDVAITVDGIVKTFEELSTLDPNDIESISVMKPGFVLPDKTVRNTKSIAIITKKGLVKQNSITTMPLTLTEVAVESVKPQDEVVVTGYSRRVLDSTYMIQGKLLSEQPVVYIDGEKTDWTTIKPADIAYVRVYKGQQAIEKYGEEGKNGAIEVITVRKFNQPQSNITSGTLLPITTLGRLSNLTVTGSITGGTFSGTLRNGQAVSNMTMGGVIMANNITATGGVLMPVTGYPAGNVVLPSFPGGTQAWMKYLDDHLDKDVVKRYGAPPGRYTVYVYFMVDPQGKISNIHAENDPGFGTVKAALRVIQQVPNWKPAELNGKTIHMGYRQAINFFVLPESAGSPTSGIGPVVTVVGKKL